MTAMSWLRRFGPCQVQTRTVGDWQVVEVRGKFVAGTPERRFVETVDDILKAGGRRIVIDLSESLLADDSVASAAPEVYHRARAAGADMRFVVPPGRKGGYYHMAGLEMTIPTYGHLGGAIEI
jgi:hypothetical protein